MSKETLLHPAMHQQVTSPPAAKTTEAVSPAPAVASPRRRKSRRRRYILIGIGALILLSIVGAVIASKREKPIPVTTEKAAKRTIVQLVSANGKVQPETEVKISPEVVAKNTYESSLHEIERAQAGSSGARDQLSKTTIYSPIDGTVTILNSKLGERIVATNQFAGTEVMRVADLGHMEARVDVNENDVVNVKVGDKATVKVDAYGDRKFHGTVYQIANTGTTTGAGTQEEVTNFQVKIRIDDHDVLLRPGLSCTADIETDMVKDVVAVPMQSVTIRTGDSNLSPEEIEKKKAKIAQRD